MAVEQRFLGELLAKRGIIPADKLESLFAVQRERGVDLLDLLINTAVADEMSIARALAEEAQVPLVERLDPAQISTALAIRVPIPFAKGHKVLIVREDDAAVHVVCGDPFDTQALDDLRVIFGKPVEASVGGRDRIEDAINRVYEKYAGE
jgi:general secretion pathway protein E